MTHRGFMRLSGILIISLLLSSCGSNFDAEKECWNPKLVRVQLDNDIYEIPSNVRLNLDREANKKLSKYFTIQGSDGRNHSVRCQAPEEVPLKTTRLTIYSTSNKIISNESPKAILDLFISDPGEGKLSFAPSRTLLSKDFDFSKFVYDRHYIDTKDSIAPMRFVYAHPYLANEHEVRCIRFERDVRKAIVAVAKCSANFRINPNINFNISTFPSRYPPEEWPVYWGLMFDALQSYKIQPAEN